MILPFTSLILIQVVMQVGVKSTTVYDALNRARGHEVGFHPFESQLIAVEKHGCYQGLAEAAGNTQNSPLMVSLREKGGQHPILEVYYFHIS